jgi:hypothetical protein
MWADQAKLGKGPAPLTVRAAVADVFIRNPQSLFLPQSSITRSSSICQIATQQRTVKMALNPQVTNLVIILYARDTPGNELDSKID